MNGMPLAVSRCPQILQSLKALNEAFIHGDSLRFEVALLALLDYCAEVVNRGGYEQWW